MEDEEHSYQRHRPATGKFKKREVEKKRDNKLDDPQRTKKVIEKVENMVGEQLSVGK